MSNPKVIPLFSAAAVNQGIGLSAALNRVLESNSFVLGKEVAGFEQEFAGYVGVAHCISLANGTDALELALRALGVVAGDRVVCVANAGFYSSTAIHLLGAVPVYIDVDAHSLTMCPDALAKVIDTRPAAVIATHLYGQMAPVEKLVAICRAAGVPLIEDCAQSQGARRSGKCAGALGDISCFSFYPTKNLGALGDGGAAMTNDPALAARLKALRQYGWEKKYEVSMLGARNSRLDELQAAVLREKLPHLDRQNAQRRSIALRYNQAFTGLPLRLPVSVSEDFVAHLYVVRTEQRQTLRSHLSECGVATDVHYPVVDTQQPAYKGKRTAEPLPVSEDACAAVMSLPCFPGLSDEDVAYVIRSVTAFYQPAGA